MSGFNLNKPKFRKDICSCVEGTKSTLYFKVFSILWRPLPLSTAPPPKALCWLPESPEFPAGHHFQCDDVGLLLTSPNYPSISNFMGSSLVSSAYVILVAKLQDLGIKNTKKAS